MKKILITGGAGFIGFFLAKKLKNKCKIDIIDNFQRGKPDNEFVNLLKNKNVKLIRHNLLKKFLPKKNYDYIFHFAAIVGVKNVINSPYRVLHENIKTLINMIEFAKNQKNLKNFFFLSTSEVYAGSLKTKLIKFPTPENQKICLPDLSDNRSSYLLSKIYGESLCIHSSLPYVILRPHNIYGPRMGNSHVIPELIMKAYSKNEFVVFNPNHKRTFCYIDDFISAIILLMNNNKIKNKVYNVGNPNEEINIYTLSKKILNMSRVKKIIKRQNIKNSSPKRRLPNINKIIQDINFKPKVKMNLGLAKTLRWYKNKI